MPGGLASNWIHDHLPVEHGFPAGRIAEESFTSPRRSNLALARQTATLISAASAQAITVDPDKTLLEAALGAGAPIGFSCCSVGCGACRVRITEHLDHVALDEPNNMSAEDFARGDVPACLVRLRGPVGFSIP